MCSKNTFKWNYFILLILGYCFRYCLICSHASRVFSRLARFFWFTHFTPYIFFESNRRTFAKANMFDDARFEVHSFSLVFLNDYQNQVFQVSYLNSKHWVKKLNHNNKKIVTKHRVVVCRNCRNWTWEFQFSSVPRTLSSGITLFFKY